MCNMVCDSDSEYVKCVECESMFHLTCKKIPTRGAKKDWTCEKCKPDKAKSSSSIGSNKSSNTGITVTKEFILNTLEAFKKEMFSEMKNYGKKLDEVTVSLQFLADAVDKATKSTEDLTKGMARIQKENDQIKLENESLRKEVRNMQTRINNMEQYSRRSNVEITGIPPTKGEDVCSIVQDIGKVIGAEIRPEEVVAAHRVPTYNRERTPQIIVQFQSRIQRNLFLDKFKEARRNTRELTANQVNKNFRSNPFYVNEHLTSENKILLSKAKSKCREVGYKYAWCKEGKIFVRKTDGVNAIRIESEDDFTKIM